LHNMPFLEWDVSPEVKGVTGQRTTTYLVIPCHARGVVVHHILAKCLRQGLISLHPLGVLGVPNTV
jgi:hypothetical protein